MLSEYVFITILFCGSILPLLAVWGRVAVPRRVGLIGILVLWVGFPLAAVVTLIVNREPLADAEQVSFRPIAVESDGYLGSASCRSCHPHHHATWYSSYHRTMTQVASRESVIAPMDEAQFESAGSEFFLEWRDEQLWASMDVPRGRPNTEEMIRLNSPIVLTTGSHHMQIFWFPLRSDTRLLGMFPYVYLKEQQRWIPRGAAFLQPTFSLSDEVGRWNRTCIACHTTFGRTRPARSVDPQSGNLILDPDDPDSYVAEFGISCEACHGPGEAHVKANHSPSYRYSTHLSGKGDPTIVNPSNLSHQRKSQVCGQCHSVQWIEAPDEWMSNGFAYRPGDDLEQSKLRFIVRGDDEANLRRVLAHDPAFVNDHFWSDGMVRISGREYNGLLESPCFQRGELSCLTCHQMHQRVDDDRQVKDWADDQLHPGMAHNQACIQCHEEFRNDEVLSQHTHHRARSSGSECYNCHMSYTTYGLLKAIRSHQIDSPNVVASLRTGRPNACNQCHLDKTLAWTSNFLSDWYGIDAPELSQDEQTIAASVLWLLRGDAGQRALMAWSYGWNDARDVSGAEWIPPYLAQLLQDPYAAVRFIAERSLRTLPGYQDLDYNFLGNSHHIDSARQQVIDQWTNAKATVKPDPTVLIDGKGTLMRAEIERLLRHRNDRPITLVE